MPHVSLVGKLKGSPENLPKSLIKALGNLALISIYEIKSYVCMYGSLDQLSHELYFYCESTNNTLPHDL